MSTVTLIRIHAGEAGADGHTYIAVQSADAVAILADGFDFGDAETLPWETLPGIQDLVAAEFNGRPPRSVLPIGTTEGTEWATWHPPVAPPPVPPAEAAS